MSASNEKPGDTDHGDPGKWTVITDRNTKNFESEEAAREAEATAHEFELNPQVIPPEDRTQVFPVICRLDLTGGGADWTTTTGGIDAMDNHSAGNIRGELLRDDRVEDGHYYDVAVGENGTYRITHIDGERQGVT